MTTPDLPTLKARAEAMRRAGATMAEIAEAVGRSPSTLHGWAAAGGWRLEEIEVFSLAPSQGEREEGDSPRVRGCGAAAGDPLTSILSPSEGERRNDAAKLSPLEAAKALHQRSADLATAGQIRAAEGAARLADRLLRTEFHLIRAGGVPDPLPPDDGPNEVDIEMADRLRRINWVYQERKAAGDPEAEKCLPPAVYVFAELSNTSVEEVLADPAQAISKISGR